MRSFVRVTGRWMYVAMAALVLAGCGSSHRSSVSANPPPLGNDAPPAQIQGVATPNSVSVVTATNAD